MKRKNGKRLAAGALAAVMTASPSPCVARVQGMALLAYGAEADAADGSRQEESVNYEALRNKWKILLCGGDELDLSTPQGQAYAKSIDELSLGLWNDLNKLGDAQEDTRPWLFKDLPMDFKEPRKTTAEAKASSSQITLTFDRLKAIVLAYETKGSQLYKREDVKKELIAALDLMVRDHYSLYYAHPGSSTSLKGSNCFGNWYDWRIGTPRQLCDLLLMFHDEVDEERMARYVEVIMANNKVVDSTGANRTWISQIAIQCGILAGNGEWAEAGKQGLKDVFKYVETGDGFYRDGSFIQHGNYAYNGGYGKALICTLAPVMNVLHNTPYEIAYEDDCQQIIYDMLFEAYEPFIYGGRFMDMVREREISRIANQDSVPGRQAIRSIIMMLEVLPDDYRARAESMLKEWLSDKEVLDQVCIDEIGGYNEYYLPAGVINIALDIADSNIEPKGTLTGHKRYGAMDRVLHMRDDFAFTISMSSQRIKNSEGTNDEGLRLWHIGDGLTYIYNSDKTLYSDNYWATVDYQRLPGTTVNRVENRGSGSGKRDGINTFNPHDFAGGTDLGEYGIAGMELTGVGNTKDETPRTGAHAKKSWFMFDDEIVAVGSDISSELDGSSVETTVENRKIKKDMSNDLLLNGQKQTPESFSGKHDNAQWIHLQGSGDQDTDVGYYFPGTASIMAAEETRTGTWDQVNTYEKFTDHEEKQNSFVTFWFDHGVKPEGENYSYVILPGKSAVETQSYNENPDIQILCQDDNIHAVRENTLGITGINFFSAGKLEGFRTEQPASVMFQENKEERTMEISFSDPTQKQNKVRLEVNLPVLEILEKDEVVEITEENGITILTVNTANPRGEAGKSYKVKIKLAAVDNTFEGFSVGETPDNWTVQSGSAKVVEESDGNQALEIKGDSVPAEVRSELGYPEGDQGYFIDFAVKAEGGYGVIALGSENKTQIELPFGNIGASVLPGKKWHQIRLKLNTQEKTCAYIIDGEFLGDKVPYEGDITHLVVKVSKGGTLLIDNLVVRNSSNTIPTTPMRLTYTELGDTFVNLKWDPSESDNPLYYILTVNGEAVEDAITKPEYRLEGLNPEERYTFTVQAFDGDENYSEVSKPLTVTTIENQSAYYVINFDEYKTGDVSQYGWTYGGTDPLGKAEIQAAPGNKEADPELDGIITDVERWNRDSDFNASREVMERTASVSNAARAGTASASNAMRINGKEAEEDKALYVYSGTPGVDRKATYEFEKQTDEQTYRFKAYFADGELGKFININLIGSNGNQAVTIMTDENKVIGYRAGNASGTTKPLLTYPDGEWIEFVITANPRLQTFSISANGEVVEELPFRFETEDINTLTISGPGGATGGIYVDDIVIPCKADKAYVLRSIVTDLSEIISVPYGTSFYDLELPRDLAVTAANADGEEEELLIPVNWSRGDYHETESGLQTIYGTMALPMNYDNKIDDNKIKIKVNVEKEIKHFQIHLIQTAGGTIFCDQESADEGTQITVTAVADEGYEIIGWVINDKQVDRQADSYTFTLESDTTISAVFQAKPVAPETKYYTVKIPSDLIGGTVTASSSYAKEGTEITLKAVPKEGFDLATMKVNGKAVEVDKNLEYRFVLEEDVTVTAVFAKKEEPEKPPVEEPEKPPVEEPEKPPVDEPEKPPVEEPEKPPVEKPEQPTLPNSRRRWSSGSVSDKRKENAPSYAVTGTWSQEGEDWCFYTNTGEKLTSDWACVLWNGTYEWFYFNADGKMADGWVTIDGETYYLNSNSDGNRGKMLTGWQSIEGKWYYFNTASDGKKGSMLRNTTTPDGYILDENGVWKAE